MGDGDDRRWAGLHPDVQAGRLLRVAQLVEHHAAELETLDVGKPIAQAQAGIVPWNHPAIMAR